MHGLLHLYVLVLTGNNIVGLSTVCAIGEETLRRIQI